MEGQLRSGRQGLTFMPHGQTCGPSIPAQHIDKTQKLATTVRRQEMRCCNAHMGPSCIFLRKCAASSFLKLAARFPTACGNRQGLITSFTEGLRGTGWALNPRHHLDLHTPAVLLQTLPASRSDAKAPLRRTKTRHVTMHRCTPTRLLTKQC